MFVSYVYFNLMKCKKNVQLDVQNREDDVYVELKVMCLCIRIKYNIFYINNIHIYLSHRFWIITTFINKYAINHYLLSSFLNIAVQRKRSPLCSICHTMHHCIYRCNKLQNRGNYTAKNSKIKRLSSNLNERNKDLEIW